MSLQPCAMALAVVAIWGFNFVVIEVGLREMPPLFLSAIRFFLVVFPAILFIPRPKASFRIVMVYGLLMFAMQFSFLFVGMSLGIPAGLSSLVLQFHVVVTIILTAVFLNEAIPPIRVLGTSLAFIGLAIVGFTSIEVSSMLGFVFLLLAALSWGLANLVSKKIKSDNVLSLVVWGSSVAPIPLMILSFAFEGPSEITRSIASLSWIGIIAILYIVYPTTILGFSIWSGLLNKYSASEVAPFTILVPVFGMLFAASILHEPMPMMKLLAAAFALTGIAINVFGERLLNRFRRLSTEHPDS